MGSKAFNGVKAVAPSDLPPGPRLEEGARVGIIGGGPAGAFFAYFLLDIAETLGRRLDVEIHEARDFSMPAPAGCNMCGGIVSESLVQMLATEGILLPDSVVQRGIDSYVLHMDVGSVRIETPLHEMRIGAVHRGLGPRDLKEARWESFDAFLLGRAAQKGARIVRGRVQHAAIEDGMPRLTGADGATREYDLLVVAGGVNADATRLLEGMGIGYRPPKTARTFIREYDLGEELIAATLGHSMHVFLLDMPGLEFAAIVPKGSYATVCLLGDGVDKALVDRFMESPEVRACFPADLHLPKRSCQCLPFINVEGVSRPFADRLLILGDCGVTRLYKDGIGAAYRTAKIAATASVLQGVSAASYERYFLPAVRAIAHDNRMGHVAFAMTRLIQQHRFARRGLLRMTAAEQRRDGARRPMSRMLWDVFTGSAPYRSVVTRGMRPAFVGTLAWDLVAANLKPGAAAAPAPPPVQPGAAE